MHPTGERERERGKSTVLASKVLASAQPAHLILSVNSVLALMWPNWASAVQNKFQSLTTPWPHTQRWPHLTLMMGWPWCGQLGLKWKIKILKLNKMFFFFFGWEKIVLRVVTVLVHDGHNDVDVITAQCRPFILYVHTSSIFFVDCWSTFVLWWDIFTNGLKLSGCAAAMRTRTLCLFTV